MYGMAYVLRATWFFHFANAYIFCLFASRNGANNRIEIWKLYMSWTEANDSTIINGLDWSTYSHVRHFLRMKHVWWTNEFHQIKKNGWKILHSIITCDLMIAPETFGNIWAQFCILWLFAWSVSYQFSTERKKKP